MEAVLDNEENSRFGAAVAGIKLKYIAIWKNRPIAIYEFNACCL